MTQAKPKPDQVRFVVVQQPAALIAAQLPAPAHVVFGVGGSSAAGAGGAVHDAANGQTLAAILTAIQALSFAAATPTFIPADKTVRVPAHTQMLAARRITVDGRMTLDGALVEMH